MPIAITVTLSLTDFRLILGVYNSISAITGAYLDVDLAGLTSILIVTAFLTY